MKKIALFLVVVILFGAGWAYLYLHPTAPADKREYAAYLPAETLLTLSLRDVNALTDLLPRTSLGHFFSGSTLADIFSEFHLSSEQIQSYAALSNQLSAALHHPVFRMVFGDDLDLALLPPDPLLLQTAPQKALEDSLVVLATTSSAQTLIKMAQTMRPGRIIRIRYGGLELMEIRLNSGRMLYAWSLENRLFLAASAAIIKRCQEAHDSGMTLEQTPLFQELGPLRSAVSSMHQFAFGLVRFEKIQSFLSVVARGKLGPSGTADRSRHSFVWLVGRTKEGWNLVSR